MYTAKSTNKIAHESITLWAPDFQPIAIHLVLKETPERRVVVYPPINLYEGTQDKLDLRGECTGCTRQLVALY